MSKMVKSRKYKGVYHRERTDGDITYYFVYRDENDKTQFQKVGLRSEGITEQYVHDLRVRTVLNIRNEELPPTLVRKKKYDLKVDDLSDYYFTNHQTQSSKKRYRQYINRLQPHFGHMSIHNVTKEYVKQFQSDMLKEVSPHTVVLYLELLSTLFNYYIKHHSINLTNPIISIEKPRIDNRREKFLSKDEIDLLMEEISNDFTLTLFVSLSLCTGARKSTVMNYTIKDVDLSHKMITSYDFKNESSYRSFLDDRTIELIKIRMSFSSNKNEKLVHRNDIKDLDRWISRSLKIVFDNLFNVDLSPDDRKNRVVIHTLRHTVLSHLGMKGCNQFLLRKISNHQSLSMLERYVKLNEETGRKEIEGLWE